MHSNPSPPVPKSMHLELPLQRPKNLHHIPKLLHGEIRQLPVQIPHIQILHPHIRRPQIQEDAEPLGVGALAVGPVFPVALVDEAALGEFLEPGDHLRAHGEGELFGSVAVVLAVGFGDEDVLVAVAFGDVDAVGTGWPAESSVVWESATAWGGKGAHR